MKMKVCTICLFLILALDLGAAAAQDFTFTVDQPLSFGKFGLRDNKSVHTIVVTTSGDTYYDDAFAVEIEAQRGEYSFSDLPPNTTFYAGIDNPAPNEGGLTARNATPLHAAGSSGFFTVEDFQITELITDGTGTGTIFVGATLKTSGSGKITTGLFNGNYELTLYY